MKVKWLVELDLFTDTEEDLIAAIRKSGREVKILKYIPFDDTLSERCEKMFDKHDCVVFYGSLNFGRKLKTTSFIPGVYLNEKAFECTSYYPAFGEMLLHENYIMMPYGDLLRRKDFLFSHFGIHNQNNGKDLNDTYLFIRPNSGLKQFTGTVLGYDNYEDGIKVAGIYDADPTLLVIVSNAKHIKKEWRFVVVNGNVISGSLYRDWTIGPETLTPGTVTRDIILLNSKSAKEICTDEKALQFADRMAKMYNPDRCWTLDLALTADDTYKIIEIGCFSCAGMYGNNLDKIVEAVSQEAEKEWQEYQI